MDHARRQVVVVSSGRVRALVEDEIEDNKVEDDKVRQSSSGRSRLDGR